MKRTPLKRKTPLRAKKCLNCNARVQSKGKLKAKSEPTERRRAKKESMARSKGLCLICDQQAVHGHHIIFLSQGGKDVPENIAPLCFYHHNGGGGVHDGKIKHLDIYLQAVRKRPDIAEYMRTQIDSWAKHAPESFVWECRSKISEKPWHNCGDFMFPKIKSVVPKLRTTLFIPSQHSLK